MANAIGPCGNHCHAVTCRASCPAVFGATDRGRTPGCEARVLYLAPTVTQKSRAAPHAKLEIALSQSWFRLWHMPVVASPGHCRPDDANWLGRSRERQW